MEYEHGDDPFDRIPEAIVLHILNKVADLRPLCQCSAVSKRFNALVPLVHDVLIKIDGVVTIDGKADNLSSNKSKNTFLQFVKSMLFTFLKPFNHAKSNPLPVQVSPAQVLKRFTHVKNLRIELPAGEVCTEDGLVLKWWAEFGSSLQSCVILGGTQANPGKTQHTLAIRESVSDDTSGDAADSFYGNGGLKLRVAWTISSLIAASTRHHLIRPIIENHPTIRCLVITDADGQGMLSMGAEQLTEFRENMNTAPVSMNRTLVPASNMKLRCASYLEVSRGCGIQGATLVVVRPSKSSEVAESSSTGNEFETFIYGAIDSPLNLAVKTLLKQKAYLMEMNEF